jgi:hypothetical protein
VQTSSLQDSWQAAQQQLQQQCQITGACWAQLLSLAQRALQEGWPELVERTASLYGVHR